jgi:pantetheine-phosphate adenylyltransferase
MNRHLSGVETAFVVGDPALSHVASSLVKDVARHGGRIDDLVTPAVAAAVRAALAVPSPSARPEGSPA